MTRFRKYISLLLLTAVFLGMAAAHPRDVFASETTISKASVPCAPFVFTKNITTQTDKVRVWVDGENMTLKVKNQSGIVFKKTYKKPGKKTIVLPQQAAKTKLKFTLTTKDGKESKASTKTVKDDGVISKKKVNSSLKKPKISGKITDKSTSVRVYARKGETLYIQNGSKVLGKVKYSKTGYQTVRIRKQKPETKLTFYVTGRKGRSAYVTKEVQDVTAPDKPEVTWNEDMMLVTVGGEPGTDVYIRHNSRNGKGSWKYAGTMMHTMQAFSVDDKPGIFTLHKGDTFSVKLVDDAGNTSRVAKTKKVKKNGTWEVILSRREGY